MLVDERFASNVPGIWAVGDIASFHDPVFGHRRLIQHWTNANHQGERLGRLLAGEDAPYDQVAFFFSEVFGTKIGLLGDLDGGHDELVMRGSLEAGALLGWYLRDERLVAALIVGQPPEVQEELNGLLRGRARLADRAVLTDPPPTPGAAFDTTDERRDPACRPRRRGASSSASPTTSSTTPSIRDVLADYLETPLHHLVVALADGEIVGQVAASLPPPSRPAAGRALH